MNRRTVLKGGLVLAVTSHSAVATAVPVDPLLDAIAAYKAGWQEFVDTPTEIMDEMCHLWQEPHEVLCEWAEPARSKEGALAALALAIEEEDIGESQLTAPMMRAAYGYLTAEVSA